MILTTYKIAIPCVPFPFEGKATATTLEAAIKKVKLQAKLCGCKPCRGLKYEAFEIMAVREI